MVYIDWDRLMTLSPETFSEDDKEELVGTLVWYSPTSEVSRKNIIQLIKILQEIIKYKVDQVESLMGALDELASKQGEEVARARQDILDEMEDLREQLEYMRRMERDSGASDDEIRKELVRLEMQNEEVLQELQEREKDLVFEKAEAERLAGLVAQLEREKLELSRELAALQEEASERRGHGSLDSSGNPEKVDELVDLVRQKNKHIMQLLDDIEVVEQDNQSLKVKLKNTREELSEANKMVSEMNEKTIIMKVKIQDAEEKINEWTEKNTILKSQLDELIEKKSKHDKDLDDFAVTLNSRVEEWKRLLDVKDLEITALHEQLDKYASMSIPWSNASTDPELKARFFEQEKEIIKLKTDLGEAMRKKNIVEQNIEDYKVKLSLEEESSIKNEKLKQLESAIEDLKTQIANAEEDASYKAEEITKLVIQVRSYERQEFGLSEAVEQLRKTQRRLQDRELKVEELIGTCNHLQIEKDSLDDENIYLREKLGLSPTHEVDSSSVRKRFESDAKTIKELRLEVEQLKDTVLELKLKNREMRSQLDRKQEDAKTLKEVKVGEKTVGSKNNFKDSDVNLLGEKYVHVVQENDALRKGMHEILNDIQNHSEGELKACSLERLLQALDARHISGWYHPAMRLHAQLNVMKGEARELRNQIQSLQNENKTLTKELEIVKVSSENVDNRCQEPIIFTNNDITNAESTSKTTHKIEPGLDQRCVDLEREITDLKLQWTQFEADGNEERQRLVNERDTLAFKVLQLGDIGESSEENKLVEFLKCRGIELENNLAEIRATFTKKYEGYLLHIKSLQSEKAQLILRISTLEKNGSQFEPIGKVYELERELTQIREEMKNSFNAAYLRQDEIIDKEVEPALFSAREREELLDQLKKTKQKLIETETLLTARDKGTVTPDAFNNELSILAGKLATSESRETSENLRRKHLESLNVFLKTEHSQLKTQVKEFLSQQKDLNAINEKLQRVLIEVKDEITVASTCLTGNKVTDDYESKIEKIKMEKRNLEELLEISQDQCKSFQYWNERKHLEDEFLNECLFLLKSSGNEKIQAVKLTQEMLTLRKDLATSKCRNSELLVQISKRHSENLELESKLLSSNTELSHFKSITLQHIKILYKFLYEVHSVFQGAIQFPNIKKAIQLMSHLKNKASSLEGKLKSIEIKENEIDAKGRELDIQLEAVQDLKSAFQSDAKDLINWHNKSTELRLRENRYKRENDFLSRQLEKLEGHVKNCNEEIASLEEKLIQREKEFDERQREWELSQLQLSQMMGIRVLHSEKEMPLREEADIQNQVLALKEENKNLMAEMSQKEAVFKEKLSEKIYRSKSLELEEAGREPHERFTTLPLKLNENGPVDQSERVALQTTLNSLQAIVKQKEETIFRYQELVKKTREEHGLSVKRLQNELRNVHNALASQCKAYSRLKHGSYQPAAADIEKYLTKIQELEEELNESQGNMSRVSSQLKACQEDVNKWKDIADEKMALVDETRERMEVELDRCREEINQYEMEAHEMRNLTHGGQGQKLIEVIQDLQEKLLNYGEQSVRPSSARTQIIEDAPNGADNSTTEDLKRHLKASRDECVRLREQIKALRALKRRPLSGKNSRNHEMEDKIQNLQEMLKLSRQHEQELEEKGLKKLRSVEEVTRWDERKRYQKSLETLQAKLKQKEVETTVAVNKMETMRAMMGKMEREKLILEAQIKNIAESSRESSRMEKLISEKMELIGQVRALEEELLALQRHQGGKAAAILHSKLEAQERKIASLELAGQASSVQITEVERLKSTMERNKAQLEAVNLEWKLNLDKAHAEIHHLRDALRHLEADRRENKISSAKRNSPSRTQSRFAYESQREVVKVKGELKTVRERLTIATNRIAELEEEIQGLQNQISLWEEKDLADSLLKTNQQQLLSDMHQELLQVKSQLSHKVHLLDKVKILLSKAASKERALNNKVAILQNMVSGNST